jgi:thermostable 8-oxoguanine DNA glycosylase
MLISREVKGIGFPLACDFLKEMGFTGFAKPDVHIKTIFKAVIRVAINVGVTP